MSSFFINLLYSVIVELVGIFGIFFVLGYILSFLTRAIQHTYLRSVGWKGILWTAWLGTPIHEFSHLIVAKLFRHQIVRVSLFAPNKETGVLGCVDHSYNPKSLWQRIGNFFIGAAPLIGGSLTLGGLLYFFVPSGKEIFTALPSTSSVDMLLVSIQKTLRALWNPAYLNTWKFWIFLYVSFCIASHLAPSSKDQESMWHGFFWLVMAVIVVNAIALLFHVDLTRYVGSVTRYMGMLTAFFMYAIFLSVIHLLVSRILFWIFQKRN